jgi:hypothetical protein
VRLRESVGTLILDENDSVLLGRFDWPGIEVPGGSMWNRQVDHIHLVRVQKVASLTATSWRVHLEELLTGGVPDEPVALTGF